MMTIKIPIRCRKSHPQSKTHPSVWLSSERHFFKDLTEGKEEKAGVSQQSSRRLPEFFLSYCKKAPETLHGSAIKRKGLGQASRSVPIKHK
jgi:hypothetical protein